MSIDIQNSYRTKGIGRRDVRRIARETIAALLARFDLPRRTGVGVLFVDNDEMIEFNRAHMNKAVPTDVLSFPIFDGSPPAELPEPHLGDMIISIEQAAAQAVACGHDVEAELRLLVVHGFLHLLGFDDTTAAARRKMNAETRAALADLGAKDVL